MIDGEQLVNQDSPGLKPDCFRDINSFSKKKVKHFIIKSNRSNILPQIGKTVVYNNLFITFFINWTNIDFFHSKGNLPVRKQVLKVKGLRGL